MARRARSTTPSEPSKAPTRRSARQAAKESSGPSSRASSVVPEDQNDGWLSPSTYSRLRAGVLSPHALTMAQKDAVIVTFAHEIRTLREEQAVQANERAYKALDTAKSSLRDHFMQEKLAALAPPPPADNEASERLDFSVSNLSTGTPANTHTAPQQQQQQMSEENATPRRSFFGSVFDRIRITTPFFSRTPSQERTTPQQQSPQKQLGELPASRKRPAPAEEEPEAQTPAPAQQPEREQRTTHTTPRSSTTSPTKKAARAPSTKDHQQETSLATITEHTEMPETTETDMADVEPTPSMRRRTIASVRRTQTPSRRAKTPVRSWDKPLPPREPNADKRLNKVRTYSTLKEELKAMEEDPEIQQLMGGRPLKRVKVDKLVKIPHNKPGDASGTYAVPDIDSDDEMEVDADEETRSNIFDTLPVESTPAPAVQAAPRRETQAAATPASAIQAPVIQAPPERVVSAPVAKAVDTPPMVFNFPDVGKNPGGRLNTTIDTYAGAKFAYGFAHFMKTGESLALY